MRGVYCSLSCNILPYLASAFGVDFQASASLFLCFLIFSRARSLSRGGSKSSSGVSSSFSISANKHECRENVDLNLDQDACLTLNQILIPMERIKHKKLSCDERGPTKLVCIVLSQIVQKLPSKECFYRQLDLFANKLVSIATKIQNLPIPRLALAIPSCHISIFYLK